MKTLLKKLTCVTLAVMSLVVFTACDNGQKAATETVEGFLNAFVTLDIETASKYLDDSSSLSEIPYQNMSDVDALMDVIFADVDEEMAAYISDFKPAFKTLIDKYTNSLAYEIVSTEKTDDGYTFSVSMTVPDAEDFNENLNDALNEVTNEDTMNKLLVSLIASGTITQNSSESEIMSAAMTEYVKLMTDAINNIDIDVTTEDATFVVREIDGKWLIIADESDF